MYLHCLHANDKTYRPRLLLRHPSVCSCAKWQALRLHRPYFTFLATRHWNCRTYSDSQGKANRHGISYEHVVLSADWPFCWRLPQRIRKREFRWANPTRHSLNFGKRKFTWRHKGRWKERPFSVFLYSGNRTWLIIGLYGFWQWWLRKYCNPQWLWLFLNLKTNGKIKQSNSARAH